jgi:hypothetical protein
MPNAVLLGLDPSIACRQTHTIKLQHRIRAGRSADHAPLRVDINLAAAIRVWRGLPLNVITGLDRVMTLRHVRRWIACHDCASGPGHDIDAECHDDWAVILALQG